MGKAFLVIDMPEGCFDCFICGRSDSSRPEWCPLQPMPEKVELSFVDHGQDQIAMGWNACINKIMGDDA